MFNLFGIIYMKKVKKTETKQRFYVTPLIKCLFEDSINLFEGQENYRHLVVETNFKIYAYIPNNPNDPKAVNYESMILDFLCEVEYVFPGLTIAHITRKSIRNAMKKGVTAEKVIYLFYLDIILSKHACASE
jgi:transcription initiation factor TFIIH subunit 4